MDLHPLHNPGLLHGGFRTCIPLHEGTMKVHCNRSSTVAVTFLFRHLQKTFRHFFMQYAFVDSSHLRHVIYSFHLFTILPLGGFEVLANAYQPTQSCYKVTHQFISYHLYPKMSHIASLEQRMHSLAQSSLSKG